MAWQSIAKADCMSRAAQACRFWTRTASIWEGYPTPRAAITVAFSGPDKKTLYVGTMGVTMGNGKEFVTEQTVRNTAMTVYKIPMLSQGFKGRAK